MAKDRKKLIHVHSSVANKQPIASVLEAGEIAVNNSAGNEFLSIKNSDSNIARFSSDSQMVGWMEKKEVIPYSGMVDNINLNTNESTIEIKLNQRVASNTPHSSDVNSSSGASFSIDMSDYAMIGANPSFSSLTVNNDATIAGDLHLISGINAPLKWVYGDVCNESSGTTNFADGSSDASRTITIPNEVSQLKRGTLSWTYGSVSASTDSNYDPGSNSGSAANCVSGASSFIIPKTISDITSGNVIYDNSCFNITDNLCVSGNITTTGGVYHTSDERLKNNINFVDDESKEKVKSVSLKTFNFNGDKTNRKIYGVIAQEIESVGLDELVYTDENGQKSVDYTSFLILRIAYLEKVINHLHYKMALMEEKLDKSNKEN